MSRIGTVDGFVILEDAVPVRSGRPVPRRAWREVPEAEILPEVWYDFLDREGRFGQCRRAEDGTWRQAPRGDGVRILEYVGDEPASARCATCGRFVPRAGSGWPRETLCAGCATTRRKIEERGALRRRDEDHRRAMEIADLADEIRRADGVDAAAPWYWEAYLRERAAADPLEPTEATEPTRGVLLRSAAWLAVLAGDLEAAGWAAWNGLSGRPHDEIRRELLEVLRVAVPGGVVEDPRAGKCGRCGRWRSCPIFSPLERGWPCPFWEPPGGLRMNVALVETLNESELRVGPPGTRLRGPRRDAMTRVVARGWKEKGRPPKWIRRAAEVLGRMDAEEWGRVTVFHAYRSREVDVRFESGKAEDERARIRMSVALMGRIGEDVVRDPWPPSEPPPVPEDRKEAALRALCEDLGSNDRRDWRAAESELASAAPALLDEVERLRVDLRLSRESGEREAATKRHVQKNLVNRLLENDALRTEAARRERDMKIFEKRGYDAEARELAAQSDRDRATRNLARLRRAAHAVRDRLRGMLERAVEALERGQDGCPPGCPTASCACAVEGDAPDGECAACWLGYLEPI